MGLRNMQSWMVLTWWHPTRDEGKGGSSSGDNAETFEYDLKEAKIEF